MPLRGCETLCASTQPIEIILRTKTVIKCFVIMPFAAEFNDVYDTIKSAITSGIAPDSIHCFRLDEFNSAGRISDDLIEALNESVICIADITGNNPNVMWETGYAIALKKPVVFISQSLEKMPFDIKDMRTIVYNRQSLASTLRQQLSKAISETLGRYEVRRESISTSLPKKVANTIAITGSMKGDETKCSRRVETILQPYLSEDATWLCGSFGLADECAIRYLIQNNQKLFVIGYHSFDISPTVLTLMEQHGLQFVDAEKEQLPKGIECPSKRDLLFLTKSDLLIVFWNGESQGAQNLVNWYATQNKDHILAFF